MKPIPAKSVTAAQIRLYMGKAQEFLDAAAANLDDGFVMASTSASVHAGIAASDVIVGVTLRKRSKGSDHNSAALLLEQAGRTGKTYAQTLRRLLALKPKAEYEPLTVSKKEAQAAYRNAEKLVIAAQDHLEKMELLDS